MRIRHNVPAALPPDVRKGFALPKRVVAILGLRPNFVNVAFWHDLIGHSPDKSFVDLTEGRRPSAHRTAEP